MSLILSLMSVLSQKLNSIALILSPQIHYLEVHCPHAQATWRLGLALLVIYQVTLTSSFLHIGLNFHICKNSALKDLVSRIS